ncbi:transcription initiation factor TFIID subunit 1-like [Dorcoceras hygrometricum]|uniref:Transcription initiation factor TFIID subunit 1-like n=1 Tax=Dorcoceras hygrometricum TaxID=472368 RepID=A0A2Z7B598_9LAMI|nr:transcription initiation factor TFIID subunit 1-like [Dorcoceras hygrometricum]
MASEESGWSAYVDAFPFTNHTEDSSYYCPDSSLVSDAAWTGSIDRMNAENVKKPGSKNRRSIRKKYFWQDDDDLEDTASSPANSPKASCRKAKTKMKMKMEDNYKTDEDKMGKQVGEEGKSGKSINMDESENDYYDLKKKGLCLMPYSSFVDYNEYYG